MQQLSQTLTELQSNPDVSAVVLTGKQGSRSFATGASIKELNESQNAQTAMYKDDIQDYWFPVIPKFRKPLIAAINGMAFGGGLELAMMCDILMASDDAKLGQPEINLGLIPGAGGCVRLPNAVGKSKAMEMVLTGEPITA